MKTEYVLKTEKLSVGYDGNPVTENIDIEIVPGEIVCVIGPNGAGKTTFIKTLIRQLKKVDGTIHIMGEELDKMSGKLLSQSMGIVLTGLPSSELMTVRDIVESGRYPYTGSLGILTAEDKSIVDEIMLLTDIADISENDFYKISDGQRQRAVLARALCQEPKLIVMDEPTSFLDIKYKLQFLKLIHMLVKEKKIAVIMTVHELEIASVIADRLLCIKDSRVDKYGTVKEVFTPGYIEELYDIDKDIPDFLKPLIKVND